MRARRVNPEECVVHGANTCDEVESRLHGIALDYLGCADLGKTHGVTASSDVHDPRCPMPDKDRYQATSKVSHHETAAQRSLDSSVDRAQRTLAHCRDGAPESSDKYGQREDAQVDEWQQRAADFGDLSIG